MHFLIYNENDRIPIQIFTEICSQESNWQKAGVGSGNGLSSNKRQAITWTNVDIVPWHIYVALGGYESINDKNKDTCRKYFLLPDQ